MNNGMTIPMLADEMKTDARGLRRKLHKLFPGIQLGTHGAPYKLTEEQETKLRNTRKGFAGITIKELADELYKEPYQIRKIVQLLIQEELMRNEKGYQLTTEQAEKVRKYIQDKEIRRKNTIGTKLKKLIKQSGITKEEIARKMGIDKKTLDTSYLAPSAHPGDRSVSRLLQIIQGESKE